MTDKRNDSASKDLKRHERCITIYKMRFDYSNKSKKACLYKSLLSGGGRRTRLGCGELQISSSPLARRGLQQSLLHKLFGITVRNSVLVGERITVVQVSKLINACYCACLAAVNIAGNDRALHVGAAVTIGETGGPSSRTQGLTGKHGTHERKSNNEKTEHFYNYFK